MTQYMPSDCCNVRLSKENIKNIKNNKNNKNNNTI